MILNIQTWYHQDLEYLLWTRYILLSVTKKAKRRMILLQVMCGLNIIVDEISILRIVFTKKYILSLFEGLPQQLLKITEYKK